MKQTTAGIRELKTRLGGYVRHVKTGGSVIITERGKPVGRIVPIRQPIETRAKELVRTGIVLWNGRTLSRARPVARTRGKRTLAELLLEARE